MKATLRNQRRADAYERAKLHSPFLRAASERWPEISHRFISEGAESAIALALESSGDSVAVSLRRQRHGLALAVALGDLAGELSLEQVTAHLSDFADQAIDAALRTARNASVTQAT